MKNNALMLFVGNQSVRTLRDILPEKPGLKALFIAKVPAPKSVDVGHYFQGKQGRMFWNRLTDYKLLKSTTEFEDDSLLSHGFGITDIVKIPRSYGNEPSNAEYRSGMDRIMSLIEVHSPKVVIFIYKGVLDQMLRLHFDVKQKSDYGFNVPLKPYFGARVFVFPLPGTRCTAVQADAAMRELARALGSSSGHDGFIEMKRSV